MVPVDAQYCMRLCRFGNERLGVVDADGGAVRDVTPALEVLPTVRYPLPAHDLLVEQLDRVRLRIAELLPAAPVHAIGDVELLSPIANPGKLIAAPVNYLQHLIEVRGDPGIHYQQAIAAIQTAGLFLKASSSLAGPARGITIRTPGRRTDHEVELAVVVGRRASRVGRDEALAYVAGYCIGLDITIRGPEERSLRKSADSYCVLGPWLVTADELEDPGALDIRLSVNGDVRQDSNTSRLILSVPELVEFASSFYTLHPGDVILTGTPEGVGPIQPGDTITASIQHIGAMDVPVRAAACTGTSQVPRRPQRNRI
jgi:2-keto-4-pentenoate hydratase/2-oxohepta-3-ene-1,7-dioic acid hydratase in catechol pathway